MPPCECSLHRARPGWQLLSEDVIADAAEGRHDEEWAFLSDEESDQESAAQKVEGLSVLSPSVHQARARAQAQAQAQSGLTDRAADEAMIQAALDGVLQLWQFTPQLEIVGGTVSDGHLPQLGITVDELLENCLLFWARFDEEEHLAPEEMKEKLKADIDTFPTAVLLVRPVGSRCVLSLCSA